MIEGQMDYTIEMNDSDLLRVIEDLKKAHDEMKKLTATAGEVANAMRSFEAVDFSKLLAQTQKSGGNDAVKKMLGDMSSMGTQASTSVGMVAKSLNVMESAINGNFRGIGMLVARLGTIPAILYGVYKGGTMLVEMAGDLSDKLMAPLRKNPFETFWQDSANAAQYAMKQNAIAMDKMVKDIQTASDAMVKELDKINKAQGRETGVRESMNKRAVALGVMTPDEEIEATRMARINNAQQSRSAAEGSLATLGIKSNALKNQYSQAEFEYNNIRAQAGGPESPELTAALKTAADIRDKIKTQYEATVKQLADVRETMQDTIANANAEIESANADAHTAKIERKNELEKKAAEKQKQDAKATASADDIIREYRIKGLSPERQLEIRNADIEKNRKELASGNATPERRLELVSNQSSLLAERESLAKESAKRIQEAQNAQENISDDRRVKIGGAGIGDVFARMYDVQKGRKPVDSAAQQTAENTRIIAENTKLLKDMGIVK